MKFGETAHEKRAGVSLFIPDKIDFKSKNVTRDKDDHYRMIKGLINQEDVKIVNIYVPNIGATT